MRNCENCIYYKEQGYECLKCHFKADTYEQGFQDGYAQAIKEAHDKLLTCLGEYIK